jgi:hypothetical protein
MAFESNFLLSSFGTWENALDPNTLKCFTAGLNPYNASKGVLNSRLL